MSKKKTTFVMDRPINLTITEYDRKVFRARGRRERDVFSKFLQYTKVKYGYEIEDLKKMLEHGRRKKPKNPPEI